MITKKSSDFLDLTITVTDFNYWTLNDEMNWKAIWVVTMETELTIVEAAAESPESNIIPSTGGPSYNRNERKSITCFFKVFGGHMSLFGATGTPVLNFWWHLLWVSKPEWVLPYSFFAEANVMYIPWDLPLVLHIANLLTDSIDQVHIFPKFFFLFIKRSQMKWPKSHLSRTFYGIVSLLEFFLNS